MIQEAYVTFDIAKLLKEKGFTLENCHTAYDDNGNFFWYGDYSKDRKNVIDAPTQQMAMRWLREVHKLYIGINIEVGDIQMLPSYDFEETVLGYNFVIYNEETLIWAFKDKTPRSYEQACETAIKYCLENLI